MSIPRPSTDSGSAGGRPRRRRGRIRFWRHRSARTFSALLLGLLLLSGIAAGAADDPEALYRDGEALTAARNRGAAEMVFQRLVRVAPDHLRGRLALARLQLEHAPAEALETLDAARALAPDSDEVYALRGRALEAQGRLPEAAEAYRQAIRLNPRRADINQRLRQVLRTLNGQTRTQEAAQRFYASPNLATLSLFGRLLLDEETPQEALAELESARGRVPSLPEIDLWIARAQRLAGSLTGESAAYERYLSANPKAAGVRLLLAAHMEKNGRIREAAATLAPFDGDASLAAGLDGTERARLAYLRSRVALVRNDVAGVSRNLEEAVRLGMDPPALGGPLKSGLALWPDDPDLWAAYAQWLERSQQPGQAVAAWLQAGLLDPRRREGARQALMRLHSLATAPSATHEDARLALSRLALADRQPEQALRLAEEIPASPEARRQRLLLQGLAYRALGDPSRSEAAFTAYVSFETDAAGQARARGWVLWEEGERAEAVAMWRQSPDALAGSPKLLALAAAQLQTAGDVQGEQGLREQLAAFPGAAPANLVRLGDLYASEGRMEDALARWDAALEQNPLDYALLMRVARQRLARGELDEGSKRLYQANALRPLPVEAVLQLADLQWARGKPNDALSLYWQVYQQLPQEPKVRGSLPQLAASVSAAPEVRRAAARIALETGRPELAAKLSESATQ